MRIKSIDYAERRGRELEWSLSGLTLGPINLLVGRNSTGKTRALNIIGNLARRTLRGHGTTEAGYAVAFEGDGDIEYQLHAEDGKTVSESVRHDGEIKLNRDHNKLSIWAEGISRFMDFEPLESEISASVRKDAVQHRFLIPLHEWSQSVRHYHFAGDLGKDVIALSVDSSGSSESKFDDSDEHRVISIIEKGKKDFGDKFTSAIIDDMASLGYDISDLQVTKPPHISIGDNFPLKGRVSAVGFREPGVDGVIFQDTASHGMFRALSLFSQITYSQLANRATCILIDDIGEGLDFERAARLIDMLRSKATKASFQLIMTTNDQFVMNHVPLEEWSVLQRVGCHVTVKNIHNSKAAFEEFKFVGLSNFSFFEMDFINGVQDGALVNAQDGAIR